MAKFKVGDKVKYVGNKWLKDISEVSDVNNGTVKKEFKNYYQVSFKGDPFQWCLLEDKLELINTNEYDEENAVNDYLKLEQVNHPKHYNKHPSGVECIEVVRHMNFNLGNAIKYLWRCGLKDGNSNIQELEKAKWYIEDEITKLKEKN